MPEYSFFENREFLLNYFDGCKWIDESGVSPEEIRAAASEIIGSGAPRTMIRARLIELILTKARIGMDARSCFAEAVEHRDLLIDVRQMWIDEVNAGEMRPLLDRHMPAMLAKAYDGACDFGHIAPDWESLFAIGFPGALKRLEHARAARNDNVGFFEASITVMRAVITYIRRLERAAAALGMEDTARMLGALAEGAPNCLPEAYQMIDLTYMLLTCVEGENLRSLGRLDRLLGGMYVSDLKSGRYTNGELAEYTRHFFAKLRSYKFSANVPFVLGGLCPDGTDAVNDYSYFLVDVYRSMEIHDPKMQIRVCDSTPRAFIVKILDCIRAGFNSFVFINDGAAMSALRRMGATEAEARDYLLIGCYEPAISGREIPCTCNGTVNFAQVITAALNNGFDPVNKARIGVETGTPDSFDSFGAFMEAVKSQYRYFAGSAIEITNAYEKLYCKINPAPLFSALMPDCVVGGADAYAGGAKYNNSSINSIGLATAVDSLAAIRKYVFDEKRLSLVELAACVNENWANNENVRLTMLKKAPKFGNNDSAADDLAVELVNLADETVNGRANGRGGQYRSGLFSINWNIIYGEKTPATPDGRFDFSPLSKNLCASMGCDRNGVTALISSVAKLNHAAIPNGAVLDVMLHPSAVKGGEGMEAFTELLIAYVKLGCFGIHFNIVDAKRLRAARDNPERYASLQVRVCGWNAYFVDLSDAEQNQFILQAEAM